jgi:hypothetical protein
LQQETNVKTLPSAIFFSGLKRVRNAICAFAAALVLGTAMFAATASIAEEVQLGRDVSKLPTEVQRMRQAILQAVMSGDIEELRIPIDMNELHPIFSKERTPDPIAYLKSVSADGNGREMLATLFNILTTGYAIKNAGTKNEMIVWPYYAAIPLSGLTPGQEVEIYRFLPPARVKEMTAAGKYSFYSVGIGQDGVWHYFSRE